MARNINLFTYLLITSFDHTLQLKKIMEASHIALLNNTEINALPQGVKYTIYEPSSQNLSINSLNLSRELCFNMSNANIASFWEFFSRYSWLLMYVICWNTKLDCILTESHLCEICQVFRVQTTTCVLKKERVENFGEFCPRDGVTILKRFAYLTELKPVPCNFCL